MKRKLNFRTYDSLSKTFLNSVLLDPNDNTSILNNDLIYTDQYTGVLDIEGKPVYENDFVNIYYPKYGYFTDEQGKFINYQVVFYNGQFQLHRNDINLTWGRITRAYEQNGHLLISGNIYDSL